MRSWTSMRWCAAAQAAGAWLVAIAPGGVAGAAEPPAGAVPAWLYPVDAARPAEAPDDGKPLRLPGSSQSFTRDKLHDLFWAADWHPQGHVPMPDVVEHGRAPKVLACGYCHTPTGQGRPENASLAGLPVTYIIRQVHEFHTGARRPAWPGPYVPADLMAQTALEVGENELTRAAGYFAMQTLRPRVRVVEAARVPRSEVVGLVYSALPGGGDEPLGDRMLEFTPDARRHELRDEGLRYVAYVPPGSVGRGRKLAREGAGGAVAACASCHGPGLKGVGTVPGLAGRSPTYLLRSMYAYRTGTRRSEPGAPMRAIAAALPPAALIDAVAYAASLEP